MALEVGARFGRYEVTALIGGGMGRVYRATDTDLTRQIALKVLPDAFVDHPDGTLWAVPFDSGALEVEGEPR